MARRRFHLALFMLLVTAAPACLAAHYTLANGNFRFYVPDGWPRIMSAQGDPEMQVFQDPDPSATSQNALARVTVTSQQVSGITSFQALIDEESSRAQGLPDYHLDKRLSTSTRFHYTATDGSVAQTYVVHYYLHDGYAIQVRCVRPTRSQAGAAWMKAFDKGCAAISDSLH
ncbi:MAG TPA: hypothetical protein VFJ01_12310 [Oleiagrimonas sp.]|nr:hypothetical protein [Oleiagrimonas sp.]